MKLDHLIQVLLPHDQKFYSFFEESAQNLTSAVDVLDQLLRCAPAERDGLILKIHEIEHRGDNVTHKIFAELNATFVTPFDREDIHLLASALDDILDNIDGCASRYVLYKVRSCPPAVLLLIGILRKQVESVRRGVTLVRDFRKTDQLQAIIREINELENNADSVFEESIADLFENERDPVQIIKLKEIYVGLETATDRCEDVANVLETLLIKHG
jgi:predicted phosphate transport protein (TIGR00153 family)